MSKYMFQYWNFCLFNLFVSCLVFVIAQDYYDQAIRVGGLFEKEDKDGVKAFLHAIEMVNDDSEIMPENRLEAEIALVDSHDSYSVGEEVCKLMKMGVAGIFGPQSPGTWNHVQSTCDTKEIPHVTATKWDAQKRSGSCLLNLYPHPAILSKAVADIVKAWNWKGFTIIYDDFQSLRRIGDLLKLADDKGYVVTVRQLEGSEDEEHNYRKVLQKIRYSEEKNIVLECSVEILFDVLSQAQQVGLMGSGYNYIITSLDFHSLDLEPFKWGSTNITGIRLVKPDTDYFKRVVSDWKVGEEDEEGEDGDKTGEEEEEEERRRRKRSYRKNKKNKKSHGQNKENKPTHVKRKLNKRSPALDLDNEDKDGDDLYKDIEDGDEEEVEGGEDETLPEEETTGDEENMEDEEEEGEPEEEKQLPIPLTQTALIHDGVQMFSSAVNNLNLNNLKVRSLECSGRRAWEFGYSIRNYMKMSELEGLSGLVKFDYEGFRTNIELEVIELTEDGIKQKGTWNTSTGLNITYPETSGGNVDAGEDLRNTTFIVLIALTHPHGMLKEASQTLTGNDRFEGFGIDLIHELSLMSGFNYTFHVQEDKSSGNPDPVTKEWDGMIGEVLAGRADLAIADITITREREQAAEFTLPYMNLGISILYRKPTKTPPSLFSFLSPFSAEVWAYMLSAYFGVSLLLFVIGRISPYEWTNPYPCIENPKEYENQFSLFNSYWFTIGSLMQQGSDLAPIAVSTRMVAAIWWFFTLIMVSSYTANLAAFLTIESTVPAFKSVEELAAQTTIKYGAKGNGSTAGFFKGSNVSTYQRMWNFMKANPDVLMATNDAGVQRVLDEPNYAFLMESTSIEYEVQRKCNLTQVGGLLDNKGYGIVMRQNSSYRNVLSKNVVKLQEKGKLTQLKNKWWQEKRGGGGCAKESEGGAASELGLDNVGGVFVVLLGGCGLAILFSFAELSFDIYRRENKISFKHEFMEEFRFISKCHGTTKPVKKSEETNDSGSELTKGMDQNSERST